MDDETVVDKVELRGDIAYTFKIVVHEEENGSELVHKADKKESIWVKDKFDACTDELKVPFDNAIREKVLQACAYFDECQLFKLFLTDVMQHIKDQTALCQAK